MGLNISATSIKSWFQYRCERKFVYETMPRDARDAVPIEEEIAPRSWADYGRDYEAEVIRAIRLTEGAQVLAPRPGDDALSERESLGFLAGRSEFLQAYQLVLTGGDALRRHLDLGGVDVQFRRGIVDLIAARMVDSRRVLRVVDIKSTQVALPFHKVQVAWYAWMLRAMLDEHGISAELDATGEIWHRPGPTDPQDRLWVTTEFPLRSYMAVVRDWTSRELHEAATRTVSAERDDTRFHVYFKCEQCEFLTHCHRAIADERPPHALDLSAVPGMSHQSKATLYGLNVRTVGELAVAGPRLRTGATDWTLAMRGPDLVERARALIDGGIRFLPGRVTLRMPARTDVAVHLVVDRDPLAGRLATIGALVVEDRRETDLTIRLIRSDDDEAPALREVLRTVRSVLHRIHEANRAGAALILHLFVYEPAESRDLAEALGRLMADPELLREVIDFVRIFPPEQAIPEPEYRGRHHLPACALRSIIEELMALPVKVSHDLARVGEALAQCEAPPAQRYVPAPVFARPFSSRLSLEPCRRLEAGTADEAAIGEDVIARLRAMSGLVEWLEDRNAAAPSALLRLQKAPFRLFDTVDPLNARGLELLRAQALLENRSAFVETLHGLAQPLDRRHGRQKCFAGLEIVDEGEERGRHWFQFRAPVFVLDVDIKPSDPMLLLSDGHPDRILDPSGWSNLRVELQAPQRDQPSDVLFVTMSRTAFQSAGFREVYERLGRRDWVIDRGHFDMNSERLENFLVHIDGD